MQTEIRHGLCLCAWIFLYCTLPTAARGRLSCRRIMCWGAYGFKDVYEVHGGGPPSLKLRRDIRLHRSRVMGCQFIPPKPECGERRRRMAEGRGLGTNRLCFCNAARRSFEKPCAIQAGLSALLHKTTLAHNLKVVGSNPNPRNQVIPRIPLHQPLATSLKRRRVSICSSKVGKGDASSG